MRFGLYPRLALTGIKKNKKLYLPYILSCIGMVMMSYIMQSLSYSPMLLEMRGGNDMQFILSLGKFVIAVFALIFLLYTNSFLIRRRYKEFGLYNILGMDKYGISRVVLWESLLVSVISLTGGIGIGVLFSKFAELGLLRAIKADIDYSFTVSSEAIIFTLFIFITIFVLLTLKSVIGVLRCRPLELLRSENTGEKPPKGNIVIAIIGLIILAVAYYIALTIKSPLTVIFLFFIAVIMVIVATYILFITGSVALCKLLKKNKNYYYKKKHFVSVSSMTYRMKRNGAGLASICILSTMVLVMISSTSSLYFGANDAISARYPREIEFSVNIHDIGKLNDENTEKIKEEYEKVFAKHNFVPKNVYNFSYAETAGLIDGKKINTDSGFNSISVNYDNVRSIYFISVADYNRVKGTNYSLSSGEALIHTSRCTYEYDTLSIEDINLNIVGKIDKYVDIGLSYAVISPTIMLVISDYDELLPISGLVDSFGEKILSLKYYYGFDAGVPDEEASEIYYDLSSVIGHIDFLKDPDGSGYSYWSSCVADEKNNFFMAYGGLFFLGIMLSIIFVFAATMIIYYKQISEGYEDASRFDIMQKVGMTKKDIKKSINSQILTVFFMPLGFAVLHLAFSFPMVSKILVLFGITNTPFQILVTAISVLAFALFYVIIYKVTSNAYYSIVSSKKE